MTLATFPVSPFRNTMQLSTLAVKGAVLAYSCQGSGPALLAVPGANGDAVIFEQAVPFLAQNFTVCTYDRRGFSNSKFTGEQKLDMPARLETDADDAAALIRHVSPGGPALVFGTSSGGIVAMELVTRHPETVSFLVAHEPPLGYTLGAEEGARVEAVFQAIYETYQAEGIVAAATQFVGTGNDTEAKAAYNALTEPSRAANARLFFEREITQYTAHNFSMDALQSHQDKIVFINGEESQPPATTITEVLAQAVGTELDYTPGGHLGYVSYPEEWAEKLAVIYASHGMI